jgi:hypothetical protein
MKTIKLTLVPILFVLLCAASCGKDEDNDSLPPETQEGKNTFGCLVNGELWKNGKPTFTSRAYGANLLNNKLTIFSVSGASQSEKSIGISISDVTETKIYSFNSSKNQATYENYVTSCFYTTDSISYTGTIEFTKLDKTNKIVSGRFNFVGKKYSYPYNQSDESCDSLISITEGRFDLKYTEY